MFRFVFSTFGNWHRILLCDTLLDVINGYISMRVTYSNPVFVSFRECTARDGVFCFDYQFRVSWVLQRPEAQKSRLEHAIVLTVDIVLTVTHSNQLLVGGVDIDTGYLTTSRQAWVFKSEQRLDDDFTFL
jgi:hypothetical protein